MKIKGIILQHLVGCFHVCEYSFIYLCAILLFTECNNDDDNFDVITLDRVEVLNNIPPGYYKKILSVSENSAYIITNNGKINKTTDGGSSWTPQNSGTELPLWDIFFLDAANGFIVGGNSTNGVILKTADGGNSWTSTNMQMKATSIYFKDYKNGFATGERILYKTNDAGKTWYEQNLGYQTYENVFFIDNNTGFLVVRSAEKLGTLILKTANGGKDWTPLTNVSLDGCTIHKIQVINGAAYLVANSGKIYKTFDKGNTWKIMDSPLLKSACFINENQAIWVGQFWHELGCFPEGMLCLTNDNGRNWESKFYPHTVFYSINDIGFVNDSTVIIVGDTSDGCVLRLHF